eukprot:3502546-Pleurochrysis_carterae.AAC.1
MTKTKTEMNDAAGVSIGRLRWHSTMIVDVRTAMTIGSRCILATTKRSKVRIDRPNAPGVNVISVV